MSSDFLFVGTRLDLAVDLLLTLLTDNVNHDDSQVLHLLNTVGQFTFILPLHLLEFVSQPAILLLTLVCVLLLCLELLARYLTLGFKHFSAGLGLVLLNSKLSVFSLCFC